MPVDAEPRPLGRWSNIGRSVVVSVGIMVELRLPHGVPFSTSFERTSSIIQCTAVYLFECKMLRKISFVPMMQSLPKSLGDSEIGRAHV